MKDTGKTSGELARAGFGRVRRPLVVGCGISGEAVATHLAGAGLPVTVSDNRLETELEPAAGRLRRLGVRLATGSHDREDFRRHDLIVLSPGVPQELPEIRFARQAGIRVISEVEYAFGFLRGEVGGITGTNGKTTTTSLLGAILSAAGEPYTVCGNIGIPLTAALERDHQGTIHCVELSSFQLEGIDRFRPRVAVLLNLQPDHQDRYPGTVEYAAAKARIFANQKEGDHAILNDGDPTCRDLQGTIRSRALWFRSRDGLPKEGAGVADGDVRVRIAGREESVMPRDEIRLPGNHNLENALAAILAARLLGVPAGAIRRAVGRFTGLSHRMERVAEIDAITYWNDSKATNVDAVKRCLESFPGKVILILGGLDKGGDFATLRVPIGAAARRVILMGASRRALSRQLQEPVPTVEVEGLEEAVAEARRGALPGDQVLLSPGCASFDAYRNFAERGEHFRRLVKAFHGEAKS